MLGINGPLPYLDRTNHRCHHCHCHPSYLTPCFLALLLLGCLRDGYRRLYYTRACHGTVSRLFVAQMVERVF
jgi:hypothetical protein